MKFSAGNILSVDGHFAIILKANPESNSYNFIELFPRWSYSDNTWISPIERISDSHNIMKGLQSKFDLTKGYFIGMLNEAKKSFPDLDVSFVQETELAPH